MSGDHTEAPAASHRLIPGDPTALADMASPWRQRIRPPPSAPHHTTVGPAAINATPAGTTSADIRQLFCNNSSLRGVPRICRADTLFLRCLWLVFVLGMFSLLVYSSARILINYHEYDVSVQTSVVSNDASDFPAITICNHYPFSQRAATLWQSGAALSPAKFNKRLRNMTQRLLFGSQLRMAGTLLFYDKVNTYYQNLAPNLTVAMSHSVDEFLLHCMIAIGNYVMVGKATECQLTFQVVSHPKYFNCYTVKPKYPMKSKAMSAVYLILDLGPARAQREWEQAFVMDVFDQAYGLRLLLHETNLYPDIENGGVHIEPGKMVEIAFETVQWMETQDSPIDKCHEARTPVIRDMRNSYDYSFEACKDEQLNALFIAKCQCLLSRLPRPVGLPSAAVPYCGDFTTDNISIIVDRLKCLESIGEHLSRQQQQQQQHPDRKPECRKRCSSYTYEQELSITQWRANGYQLHWMLDQSHSWKRLKESNSEAEKRSLLKRILHYLRAKNLTELPPSVGWKNLPNAEANYAYVVVRRKSFDTLRREEKLTVTFEALMSRIGGLCSLYLGLTMVFFVEIVEFLYLALRHAKRRSK